MNNGKDIIKQLVQEELDAARRLSPEEDLKARLKALIPTELPKRRRQDVRLLRAIPVLGAALLVVVAAIAVRRALRPSRADSTLLDGITGYLQSGPGIQTWSAGQEPELRPKVKPEIHEESGATLERLFGAGLSSVAQTGRQPPRVASAPAGRALSLEETIRILFIDRSLEKCVSQLFKKTGEE